MLPEKGGVYYEASDAAISAEVISKGREVAAILKRDARFTECLDSAYSVRFRGAARSSFEGFTVSMMAVVGDAPVLVLGCPFSRRDSRELAEIRAIIESALGPELVRKLHIEVRYSALT